MGLPAEERKRFHWRYVVFALIVILAGLGIWALTWDWEPKVHPRLFPHAELRVTNNAWIGYEVEPFEVKILSGEAVLLKLRSDNSSYIQARGMTVIPLKTVLGDPRDLRDGSLFYYRIQARVTARKWFISKTVNIDEQISLGDLLAGTIEAIRNALPKLP